MSSRFKAILLLFSHSVICACGIYMWSAFEDFRATAKPGKRSMLRCIPLFWTAEKVLPGWTTNYESYLVLLNPIDSKRQYFLVALLPKPSALRQTNTASEEFRFLISFHKTDGCPILIRSEELPGFGEPPFMKLFDINTWPMLEQVAHFPSLTVKLESIR